MQVVGLAEEASGQAKKDVLKRLVTKAAAELEAGEMPGRQKRRRHGEDRDRRGGRYKVK